MRKENHPLNLERASKPGHEHAAPAPGGKEHRCFCGQLLARLTPAGVELKCKRCRRLELIPWERGRK